MNNKQKTIKQTKINIKIRYAYKETENMLIVLPTDK